MFITLADFDSRWGGVREQDEEGGRGGKQTTLGRMNVYLGGNLLNVLGLGGGAGGGEGGAGAGGRGAEINGLELRHGWLDRS